MKYVLSFLTGISFVIMLCFSTGLDGEAWIEALIGTMISAAVMAGSWTIKGLIYGN